MLQRSSQVGEFYRMCPPAVFDMTAKLPGSYMGMLTDLNSCITNHTTYTNLDSCTFD